MNNRRALIIYASSRHTKRVSFSVSTCHEPTTAEARKLDAEITNLSFQLMYSRFCTNLLLQKVNLN